MDKEIKKISESIDRSKTILLPKDLNSDCYAVYSKEEFNNPDEKLIVDGKAYKHRLYLYKKNPKSDSDKILTFIILNPGSVNHNDSDALIQNCLDIAGKEYGAIEVFSIFTLRTIDNIDAVSEDAMLDAMRADLSKNDIVLAWGDELKRTEKYSNISDEDLAKINKVRKIKINEFLDFICSDSRRRGKIFVFGLTDFGNPKSIYDYEPKKDCLMEFTQH